MSTGTIPNGRVYVCFCGDPLPLNAARHRKYCSRECAVFMAHKWAEERKPVRRKKRPIGCVTPNGRIDGHMTYSRITKAGRLVCAFCGKPPRPVRSTTPPAPPRL